MWTFKKRRSAQPESYAASVWENVVMTVELHRPAASDEEMEAVLAALDQRRSWVSLGTCTIQLAPPVLQEIIPAPALADRGRSVDELRAATCRALLAAGLDASVRVTTEWIVST